MSFLISSGLKDLKVDTLERVKAYDLAAYALNQKQKNPSSKLWRMRVRQALKRLEELYGIKYGK
jgi:hypothetical protein